MPFNEPMYGRNLCRFTNISMSHKRLKAPVQPWLMELIEVKGFMRSRFVMLKRRDYFGRGCHLPPSSPSREDLFGIKVAKNRFTLPYSNAAGNVVVLLMIQQPSQVEHPHLSKLHPPPYYSSVIIISGLGLVFSKSSRVKSNEYVICLPSPTLLFWNTFKR